MPDDDAVKKAALIEAAANVAAAIISRASGGIEATVQAPAAVKLAFDSVVENAKNHGLYK